MRMSDVFLVLFWPEDVASVLDETNPDAVVRLSFVLC